MTATRTDDTVRPEARAAVAPETLLAWGRTSAEQLGDGTTTNRALLTPVPDLAGVVSLAEGPGFTLAVLANGTLRAWGQNSRRPNR